jgi:hypothetical protein
LSVVSVCAFTITSAPITGLPRADLNHAAVSLRAPVRQRRWNARPSRLWRRMNIARGCYCRMTASARASLPC